MDVCVKSEPEDEHISHPEYCPEVQGFSAEEMGSRLHLDIDRIKTEIVTVKIMEDNTHLQLCSTTKVLCTPLEQLNSPVSLSSKQYKSETEEVKVEQHSKFQKTSWAVKDITEAAHCIKDEWKELKVNEGSSVPCPLSKQCKSETDEVKVEQHSQLQGSSSPDSQINNFAIHSVKEECMNLHVNEFRSVPCSLSVQCKLERSAVKKEQHSQLQAFSCTELEINNSANHSLMERCPNVQVAHELSQNNSEKLENCAIIAGADVQTKGAVEQSGGCVTSTVIHKATEQPRHDGVTCSAQKWQFLEGKEVFESQSHLKMCLQNDLGYKHYVQSGTSSTSVHLKLHRFVHAGETPYRCSECGKTFSCLSTFQQHQLANSSKFKCIHCGKSFSRGSHLKQHQLVHSGEKPYKCSECGKTFSREYNLQLHQLVHSGEKPHECSVCGKSFSHGSTLKRHQVIHTGEKPYKCECGKGFASKQYFKKHAATHGIFYADDNP